MSKASILRQLSDEDLEAVHHLIRRDAYADLAIAKQTEVRGQRSDKIFSLGPTDKAREMTIARYRQSPQYKKWLTAWENRDAELRKAIETQKQRFELISTLVRTGETDGFETVSKSLQARLLTLAAEADDATLKDAAKGKGWVCEILRLAQADVRDSYRRKVEELKAEIQRMLTAKPGERKVDTKAVIEKVDEIMGLKK